jgi:hypothetical protein
MVHGRSGREYRRAPPAAREQGPGGGAAQGPVPAALGGDQDAQRRRPVPARGYRFLSGVFDYSTISLSQRNEWHIDTLFPKLHLELRPGYPLICRLSIISWGNQFTALFIVF